MAQAYTRALEVFEVGGRVLADCSPAHADGSLGMLPYKSLEEALA